MAPIRRSVLAAAVLLIASALAGDHGEGSKKKHWVDIWATMPQLTEPANLPPVPFNGSGVVFQDATIRQTIQVSLSASTLRLQISNAFGGSDLPITAATIALPVNGSAGTSGIVPSTVRNLTFSGGSANYTIPSGALALTDPVDFPVGPLSVVTISLYLAAGQTTNSITSHPGSRTTSFWATGNHVSDASLAIANSTTQQAEHWYFISTLSAYLPASSSCSGGGGGNTSTITTATSALAIIGDSITDGRGSTNNANNRWPDVLRARLQAHAPTSGIAVLNLAAGGNRVLNDGLGPNALGRIDRDVLAASGLRYALLYEGINDIATESVSPAAQANIGARLVAAYDQVVTRLHARGVPAFGATITPFGGPAGAYGDPERERTRQRVNAWVRGSGRFDAVVDFDEVVRDPAKPDQLRAEYDSGDNLHLTPAGYQAMGGAVDLALFERFEDGVDSML